MKNLHTPYPTPSSRTLYLLWLSVFAWLGTLLFLSFQTGEETAETSGRLAMMVFRTLSTLGIETSYAVIHGMLRTAAHIVGFLIFGGLLEAAVIETMKVTGGNALGQSAGMPEPKPRIKQPFRKARGLLNVLFACAVVAVLSEVLKIYIPGRHLDWPEAGLNVVGAWLGCGGIYAVERLCEKRKHA